MTKIFDFTETVLELFDIQLDFVNKESTWCTIISNLPVHLGDMVRVSEEGCYKTYVISSVMKYSVQYKYRAKLDLMSSECK